jgi:hypothetical protein
LVGEVHCLLVDQELFKCENHSRDRRSE